MGRVCSALPGATVDGMGAHHARHDLSAAGNGAPSTRWRPIPRRRHHLAPGTSRLCPHARSVPPGAASRGEDRRQAAPQRRRAPAPCAGLEPVEKVVTQSVWRGLKSYAHAGSSSAWRCASGRKSTGRIVHVILVSACVTDTVHGSARNRARRVSMRSSCSHYHASSDASASSAGEIVRSATDTQRSACRAE